MAELRLPENSRILGEKIHKPVLADSINDGVIVFQIYRYDPENAENPRVDVFTISKDIVFGRMILDYLMFIKDKVDHTFAFRKSCREGVCGSCAMNINGKNRLACNTNIEKLLEGGTSIRIMPLPSMKVIRDLVVDLSTAFNQYKSVKPWIQRASNNERENLQTPKEREKLDGLWECILCFSCTTSCPSYWWNGSSESEENQYLGPATLMQAYRWISDSRDENKYKRVKELDDKYKLYRCQTILNCTSVCPKGLNPGKAIVDIKKQLIKS